jgi:L-tartrate/succinate antiporter
VSDRPELWRAIVPLVLGAIVALTPVPAQLTPNAWYYFALFVTVVVALITEPVPGPVVGLVAVATAATLLLVAPTPTESIRWALTGFADSTVWLMLVVFMFALGYQATGLGRRIALTLVRSLGGRTLGLGYAVALADLALAPLTPSNTARSAGIIFPIIESIPALYGSAPGPTARRIGAYLMWTAFGATCVTSSMFLTALAPNLLARSMLKEFAGVTITWSEWFVGFLPIGLVLFALLPALAYLVYPPTVKASPEVPRWAGEELDRMGRITRREVSMALLALFALTLWVFAAEWINVTTAALVTLCLMLLTRVIRWDDVLAHGRAWNALTWFATLVTLADGLNRVGFLRWLAGKSMASLGETPVVAKTVAIVLVFFLSHYLFASLTAHTTAFLPVFVASVAAAPGVPVKQVSLLLCYGLGLMGILTPYATGAAPIYFGSGYITRKEFWSLGSLFGLIFLIALLGLGIPYLRLLHPQ